MDVVLPLAELKFVKKYCANGGSSNVARSITISTAAQRQHWQH
jgi:hypothetical protein